jgi:hypothetical protein
VSEPAPTAEEARAALSEVTSQATRVHRSDHQLGWMLLGVAAVYLAVGGLMSTLPDPRRGGPVVGLAILTVVIAGAVGFIFVGLGIRAYSRAGIVLYFVAIAVFNLWNAIVVGVSIGSRWWAPGQPGYHFGLSVAVGVIPLLVAGWLIRRR